MARSANMCDECRKTSVRSTEVLRRGRSQLALVAATVVSVPGLDRRSGRIVCCGGPVRSKRRLLPACSRPRLRCKGRGDGRRQEAECKEETLRLGLGLQGLRCSKGADASTPRLEFLDDDFRLHMAAPSGKALLALEELASALHEDPGCYTIGILGDLHLDPRDLEDSMIGRQQPFCV